MTRRKLAIQAPGMGFGPGAQLRKTHVPKMKSRVSDYDHLGQAQPAAHIGHGAK